MSARHGIKPLRASRCFGLHRFIPVEVYFQISELNLLTGCIVNISSVLSPAFLAVSNCLNFLSNSSSSTAAGRACLRGMTKAAREEEFAGVAGWFKNACQVKNLTFWGPRPIDSRVTPVIEWRLPRGTFVTTRPH